MTKLNNNKNYKSNNDKEMAELYLKLFDGCIKFKQEKNKDINCNLYYNSFLLHTKEYNKNKENL